MLLLAEELREDFGIALGFTESNPCRVLMERACLLGLETETIDPKDFARTVGWLQRLAPDLIHIHAGIGWEGHGLARAARAIGLTSVRTEHLPYLLTDGDQQTEHRAGLDLVDRIIAVSQAAAESLILAGIDASKLTTVRNGVRPRPSGKTRAAMRQELGLAADDDLLLMVARLTPQKGHDTLLDALPLILAQRPGTWAVFAGSGPEHERLTARLWHDPCRGHVIMLGHRGDIPDLLATADVLVLPSHFEGLPLAVLEAMAAGLPIVASRIGGTVEALGHDYPFLVPPADPNALANAVSDLLSSRAVAADLGAALRRRFHDRFEAGRMAEEIRGIYAGLHITSNSSQRDHNRCKRPA